VEKNAADYIEAIDLLQQVLKREPAELRSLFNLGLVYRQTSMLDEALAVWKRFLETNPPQGWADEARKQIREIEEIRNRKHALDRVVKDPAQFAAGY